MSAATLLAELVAEIDQLQIPVTSDPSVFPPMLAQSGVAVLVDLPTFDAPPTSAQGVRLQMVVRVVAVPADPRGPAPLLDTVELVANAIGARGQLFPSTFDVTPETQAPAYTITVFRKE